MSTQQTELSSPFDEELTHQMDEPRSTTTSTTTTTYELSTTPSPKHRDSISNENDEVVTPQPRSINPDLNSGKNGTNLSAVGLSWTSSTSSPHRRSSLPWAMESSKSAATTAATFASLTGTGHSTSSSPLLTRRSSMSPESMALTSNGNIGTNGTISQPYVPPPLIMANQASEYLSIAARKSLLPQKEEKEITRSLRSSSSSSLSSSSSSPARNTLSSTTNSMAAAAAAFGGSDAFEEQFHEEEEESERREGEEGQTESHTFDHYVPPKLRTRSKSINSFDPVFSKLRDYASPAEDHPSRLPSANTSQQDLSSIWNRFQGGAFSSNALHHPGLQTLLQANNNPASNNASTASLGNTDLQLNSLTGSAIPHRRSSTFSYPTLWENNAGTNNLSISRNSSISSTHSNNNNNGLNANATSFGGLNQTSNASQADIQARSLPGSTFSSPDQFNRLRNSNSGRFSISHSQSSSANSSSAHSSATGNSMMNPNSEQYDTVSNLPSSTHPLGLNGSRRYINATGLDQFTPRRHSVAGPINYALQTRYLADAFNGMTLEELSMHNAALSNLATSAAAVAAAAAAGQSPYYGAMMSSDMEEYYDPSNLGGNGSGSNNGGVNGMVGNGNIYAHSSTKLSPSTTFMNPAAAAAAAMAASSGLMGYPNPLMGVGGNLGHLGGNTNGGMNGGNFVSNPTSGSMLTRHSISGPTSSSAFSEVGRGIPLHALPSTTPLYIVEFKAGRSDIFYVADNNGYSMQKGDLVIVEADRGKDLGKVINHSITPHQIHMLQAQQPDALNELHRVNKEIHPKRIYRLAQPPEVAMLVTKSQDEAKAMAVCQTKVRQKKLTMEVVDAEYQWDRRKLTFYFIADRRIDFRELVRDLFKIYKTRIWMCAVNSIHKASQSMMYFDSNNTNTNNSNTHPTNTTPTPTTTQSLHHGGQGSTPPHSINSDDLMSISSASSTTSSSSSSTLSGHRLSHPSLNGLPSSLMNTVNSNLSVMEPSSVSSVS